MTTVPFGRVEPIVAEALGLDAAARGAYVDRACGADAALRHEVEAWLTCDREAGTFLSRSALEDAALALRDEVDLTPLLGRQIAGYRLDALIGAGGMGEVYRAHDLRLARAVALKVLTPSSSPDRDHGQVVAEARAASRLNHPNVVTIHAVGEDQGLAFIAMELVAGTTLRERLAVGPLALADAVALAAQLAEALVAAHGAGLVHRDLKPDNVMVTPAGLLKVLDFGIAGHAYAGAAPLGGTAGYMSPEQADGHPARPSSDLFSFGVILYEMVTGQQPFIRANRADTLAAVRQADPPPMQRADGPVPPALAALVDRCLAATPEARIQDAGQLVTALQEIRASIDGRGLSRRRVLTVGLAAAALVATGTAVWSVAPGAARRRSIAVMPFRNRSDDPGSDFLAGGLTATLIERLSVLPALTVLPRSLVANFEGAGGDAVAVARQLHADVVLDGAILRRGDALTIDVRLIEVATGRASWATTYERPATELLIVEEEIAQAIVDQGVRLRLSADQRRRLTHRPTSDPLAYELYLHAVHLCQQEAEDTYLEARDLLREAITRDPHFGPGHVQMATTYAVMTVDGLERPTDAWPESSRHVRRALAADPDLGNAHASSASMEFFFNWDWDAAEDEWRKAMRFGGADVHPDLHTARALQRCAVGRADEALALVRRARQLDPVTPMFMIREADLLLQVGEAAAASNLYRQVLTGDGDDVRALSGLAEASARLGRLDDAVAERRRQHEAAGEDDVIAGPPAATAAEELRRLDHRSARAQLAQLTARAATGGYVSPLDVARQHARMGEPDAAAALFDGATAERAAGLAMLDVDRAWDGMRGDPRFIKLRSRIGLANLS